MAKETFVFHKEWRDAISGLPDEVRLEFYEAVIEYGTSGRTTGLKQMAMLAFNFVKTTIDKENDRYESICKKNRENGKKGGRPRKTQENPKKPSGFEENPKNPNNELQEPKGSMSNSNLGEKSPKGDKKKGDLSFSHASEMQKRALDFSNTLLQFVPIYGKEMVDHFYDYWTEPNKSKTKMRFELEKTWDVRRRLATWASRDNNFNNKNNGTDSNRRTTAEYIAEAQRAGIEEAEQFIREAKRRRGEV